MMPGNRTFIRLERDHVEFFLYPREDELKAALAAHEAVAVLQKLCEGRKVPGDLRLALWKVRGTRYVITGAYPLSSGVGMSGSVSSA